MDDADLTEDLIELQTKQALARARALAAMPPTIYETCRSCAEALTPERQTAGFCCPECRDDFEKRQAAAARAGGRQPIG